MTAHQNHILMNILQEKPNLNKEETSYLAQSLNISEPRIQRWFSDKRAANRQKGLWHKGEKYSIK